MLSGHQQLREMGSMTGWREAKSPSNLGQTLATAHIKTESLAGLGPELKIQGTQRLIRITRQQTSPLKDVNPFRDTPQAGQSHGHPSGKGA